MSEMTSRVMRALARLLCATTLAAGLATAATVAAAPAASATTGCNPAYQDTCYTIQVHPPAIAAGQTGSWTLTSMTIAGTTAMPAGDQLVLYFGFNGNCAQPGVANGSGGWNPNLGGCSAAGPCAVNVNPCNVSLVVPPNATSMNYEGWALLASNGTMEYCSVQGNVTVGAIPHPSVSLESTFGSGPITVSAGTGIDLFAYVSVGTAPALYICDQTTGAYKAYQPSASSADAAVSHFKSVTRTYVAFASAAGGLQGTACPNTSHPPPGFSNSGVSNTITITWKGAVNLAPYTPKLTCNGTTSCTVPAGTTVALAAASQSADYAQYICTTTPSAVYGSHGLYQAAGYDTTATSGTATYGGARSVTYVAYNAVSQGDQTSGSCPDYNGTPATGRTGPNVQGVSNSVTVTWTAVSGSPPPSGQVTLTANGSAGPLFVPSGTTVTFTGTSSSSSLGYLYVCISGIGYYDGGGAAGQTSLTKYWSFPMTVNGVTYQGGTHEFYAYTSTTPGLGGINGYGSTGNACPNSSGMTAESQPVFVTWGTTAPPPQSTYPVTLTASATQVSSDTPVTLTASTNMPTNGTWALSIWDLTTGTVADGPGTGVTIYSDTLTIQVTPPTYPGGQTYRAEVNQVGGSAYLDTFSAPVTVMWGNLTTPAYTVTLTTPFTQVSGTTPVTLTATANRDVGGSPYFFTIVDQTTNTLLARCYYGITCTATAKPPPGTQTYIAYIGNDTVGAVATSAPLTVNWGATTIYQVNLTATPMVLTTDTYTWLVATANMTVYASDPLVIWDETTNSLVTSVSYGSADSGDGWPPSFPSTQTYVAYVGPSLAGPSGALATSAPVTVKWEAPSYKATLTASATSVPPSTPVTLTATAITNTTGYQLVIWDQTANTGLWSGYAPTGTLAVTPPSGATYPYSQTYVSYIVPAGADPWQGPSSALATSAPVTVTWTATPATTTTTVPPTTTTTTVPPTSPTTVVYPASYRYGAGATEPRRTSTASPA